LEWMQKSLPSEQAFLSKALTIPDDRSQAHRIHPKWIRWALLSLLRSQKSWISIDFVLPA
jgi:hypothetical protein